MLGRMMTNWRDTYTRWPKYWWDLFWAVTAKDNLSCDIILVTISSSSSFMLHALLLHEQLWLSTIPSILQFLAMFSFYYPSNSLFCHPLKQAHLAGYIRLRSSHISYVLWCLILQDHFPHFISIKKRIQSFISESKYTCPFCFLFT